MIKYYFWRIMFLMTPQMWIIFGCNISKPRNWQEKWGAFVAEKYGSVDEPDNLNHIG